MQTGHSAGAEVDRPVGGTGAPPAQSTDPEPSDPKTENSVSVGTQVTDPSMNKDNGTIGPWIIATVFTLVAVAVGGGVMIFNKKKV